MPEHRSSAAPFPAGAARAAGMPVRSRSRRLGTKSLVQPGTSNVQAMKDQASLQSIGETDTVSRPRLQCAIFRPTPTTADYRAGLPGPSGHGARHRLRVEPPRQRRPGETAPGAVLAAANQYCLWFAAEHHPRPRYQPEVTVGLSNRYVTFKPFLASCHTWLLRRSVAGWPGVRVLVAVGQMRAATWLAKIGGQNGRDAIPSK